MSQEKKKARTTSTQKRLQHTDETPDLSHPLQKPVDTLVYLRICEALRADGSCSEQKKKKKNQPGLQSERGVPQCWRSRHKDAES